MTGDDIDATTTTLADWLGRLAEPHGAPGGGAASAVMAAISAALLAMVAGYTDDPDARAAVERLGSARRSAESAAESDGIRSAAFGAALAMDEGPDREVALRSATVDAIGSSLDVGRLSAALVGEVRLLAEIGNPHVRADLIVAAGALAAALDGAVATVRADLDLLANHRGPDDGLDEPVGAADRDLRDLDAARRELQRLAIG